MPRRFARQCSGQRCDLCRSKVLNSKRCCSCTVPAIYRIWQRSSLISATLAHFAEFGIVIQRRVRDIDRLLLLLGGTRQGLPELAREMLGILATQLREIDARIQVVEAQLMTWHRSNEVSLRLATIPGVGPITASAIVATIADARQFKSGRQFAAWLGLVPQQRSSGGKERLGGISKRGDGYIRRLMIHGARAIVGWRKRAARRSDHWIDGLMGRRHINVVTVALANKSARVLGSYGEGEYLQPRAGSGSIGRYRASLITAKAMR